MKTGGRKVLESDIPGRHRSLSHLLIVFLRSPTAADHVEEVSSGDSQLARNHPLEHRR